MKSNPENRKNRIVLTIAAGSLVLLAAMPIGVLGSRTYKPTIQEEIPSLTIKKIKEDALVFDADNDQVMDPGDRVRYVITYENSGIAEVVNVKIEDDYDESLVSISQVTEDGNDNGQQLLWEIDTLLPGEGGELSYIATLKTSLVPGLYKILNMATIYSDRAEPTSISIQHEVNIEPTPEPTATQIPSPTAEPTVAPAPTTTPVPPPPTVGASAPTDNVTFYVIMGVLIGILELGGLVVIGFIARYGDFATNERSRVVRVSVVVTMVVGAVLIMGVFGGIERGAAAGILGTVAGYLLRGIKEE